METFDGRRLGTKGPVKTPSGFMPSGQRIAQELARKCPGGHQHLGLWVEGLQGQRSTQRTLRSGIQGIAEAEGLRQDYQLRDNGQDSSIQFPSGP